MTNENKRYEISDTVIDSEYQRLLAQAYNTAPTDWDTGVRTIFALCKAADLKCERVERFGSLPALVRAYHAAGGKGFPTMFMGRLDSQYMSATNLCAREFPELDDEPELRKALIDNIASGVCWFPCEEGYAVACDGPSMLSVDDDGNLHNASGPAIAWPDGERLYAWHGVFVPMQWIVEPRLVDVRAVLASEQNQELLRCLGEIVGFEAYLDALDAKLVHEDPDPVVGGKLYRVRIAGQDRQLCKVKCGTGRTFVLPVGNESTVVAALAATYGVSERVYRTLKVRT